MKEISGIAGIMVVVILVALAISWAITGHNFLFYQFWAPKFENARRSVYTQTLSYQKGSADRLAALCNQIVAGGDKSMLRAQIAQEFSDISTSDMPDYLQSCLADARSN